MRSKRLNWRDRAQYTFGIGFVLDRILLTVIVAINITTSPKRRGGVGCKAHTIWPMGESLNLPLTLDQYSL